MDEAANRTEIVFKTRNRQSCGEPQLVLASAGISSNLMQADGWWVIVVAPSDGAVALDELKLHQQDNADQKQSVFPFSTARSVALASTP